MNLAFKVAAFAFVAIGTAMVSAASPSLAQAQRQALPGGIVVRPTPAPPCCVPAQRPVNTNTSWMVKAPGATTPVPAVVLDTQPAWHAPFPGSQWIGPVANASTTDAPGGDYVYTYHFCLCGAPKGVSVDFFPAALYLTAYDDNSFDAYLNNNHIGQDHLVNGYTNPTLIPSAQPMFFKPGDNELKFVVNNVSGPMGLDVSGWISGYFQQIPPGGHCPN